MPASTVGAESAQVIYLADHRRQKPAAPARLGDLVYWCLCAKSLKAEHDADIARLDLERYERGLHYPSKLPADLQEIIENNRDRWDLYRAMIKHLAAVPAKTRQHAQMKRYTIGRLWLRCDGEFYDAMRAGCIADDHLFPPSQKLKKGSPDAK